MRVATNLLTEYPQSRVPAVRPVHLGTAAVSTLDVYRESAERREH
jgi:hypothetical protein